MCVYIYIYTHVCIYIYIYVYYMFGFDIDFVCLTFVGLKGARTKPKKYMFKQET